MRLVVSDTGPILHLVEADALDLLQLAGEVHIPDRVHSELSTLVQGWNTPVWILIDNLEAPYSVEAQSWHQAGLLDAGEADVLALAQQLGADWVLTDDAAARLLGQSLGLEVHGSLGVVLWAAGACHLTSDEARSTLYRLAQSSLWISTRVLADAILALDHLFESSHD